MDHPQLMGLHQVMVLHPNSKASVPHPKVTAHPQATVLLPKAPLQDMECSHKALHLRDTLHLQLKDIQ